MYKNVDSSTICNNSKLKTIQMPINSGLNKEKLVWQSRDQETCFCWALDSKYFPLCYGGVKAAVDNTETNEPGSVCQ